MKALKFLGVAALASLLAACSGDTSSTLGDPIDGIAEGTNEDLAARAGAKVYFDFNMYDLKTEARDVLNLQAEWLGIYTDVNVVIEGHADERGTRAYNQGLGSRRGNSVKTYLLERGIDASRIKVVSYGEEKPEMGGHDEESWAKNRRSVTIVAQ